MGSAGAAHPSRASSGAAAADAFVRLLVQLLFGLVARFFRPLNPRAAAMRKCQPPGAITIRPDAVFEMGMW